VLADAGFKTIVDLVAEKVLSTDNTTVTTKRYIDANRQTVQKYVDAQTQAIAKMKKDKAFTLEVLRKYKIVADDQRQMNSVYDFYVNQIFPLYTYPTKETFESTRAELVKTNPKVADLDVTRVFDASFVKNAEDRKVGQ
jgi:ABC-type nitrate/sulfonate/bicarbonate transport system substrate-binding protein